MDKRFDQNNYQNTVEPIKISPEEPKINENSAIFTKSKTVNEFDKPMTMMDENIMSSEAFSERDTHSKMTNYDREKL